MNGYSLRSKQYGDLLEKQFQSHSLGKRLGEVPLFQALQASIVSTAPRFPVEELHGRRSHVDFHAQPWTRPSGRCELCDLCIVWFRRKPTPEGKITFLQAKLSKRPHALCRSWAGPVTEVFYGDSTQWHLLHNRPRIRGSYSTFRPPPNLLEHALLSSIGSFCVFHSKAPQTYDFFYASAAVVTAARPRKAGNVLLKIAASAVAASARSYTEQLWACCPKTFGMALYSGFVGTPFDYNNVVSSRDDSHRDSVRRWLAATLSAAARQQRIGPVVTTFLNTFDLGAVPDQKSNVPGRAIIFIHGEEEENRQ